MKPIRRLERIRLKFLQERRFSGQGLKTSERSERNVGLIKRLGFILIIAFAFLSGPIAKANPVENFFRRLGRSISKAVHEEPAHHSNKKKSASKQSTTADSKTAENGPGASSDPADRNSSKKFSPGVRRASAASGKKGKDLPFGIPVPGKKGFVTSPYSPDGNYVDVRSFAPGTEVKDPYTGKTFRVP